VPRRALHLAGLSLRDFLQPLFPEPLLEVFQAMADFDPLRTLAVQTRGRRKARPVVSQPIQLIDVAPHQPQQVSEE